MSTISLKSARLIPTYLGSAAAFLGYLFFGAVPGAVYGGFAGLIMAGTLFGTPVEPTLVTRVITGGGVVLGLVTSLFLFLVIGALAGTVLGLMFRPLVRVVAPGLVEENLASSSVTHK